ncbi:MAG: PHP domain-containing protein, partial [Clostridiales bacterium]|nr:PHP domain-containing protein [Clostridiales bacterium]
YHTHTTYSHGKGSVLQNAEVAAERGLKEIAITDHGLRHVCFGIRRRKLPALKNDCAVATEKTGVHVLAGVENNFCDFYGSLDAKADDLERLDIVQGGYHKVVWSPTFGQTLSFQMRNLIRSYCSKSPAKLIVRNTDAYLKLIDNYELDFIGHLNRDIRADALTIARYAKEKGTYIEINCKELGKYKALSITDAELEKMTEEGVEFICNSDAHCPERVGDMSAALELIERLHIPYDQIANWEKFPSFRSHNYKRATDNRHDYNTDADKPSGEAEGESHVD